MSAHTLELIVFSCKLILVRFGPFTNVLYYHYTIATAWIECIEDQYHITMHGTVLSIMYNNYHYSIFNWSIIELYICLICVHSKLQSCNW